MECCDGVEGFGGVYDFRAMGEGREEAKGQAETVEKRWWTAEGIGRCEGEAVANEVGVIY